jgi:hypothetical protein
MDSNCHFSYPANPRVATTIRGERLPILLRPLNVTLTTKPLLKMSQTSTLEMGKSSALTGDQAETFDADDEVEAFVYMHGVKLHLLTLG